MSTTYINMEGVLLLLLLTSLKWFAILINAEATITTFPTLNATDLKSFNKSSILRYGHHRTQKCSNFEKTYVCINSCLERGYDIASANEDCECTCFKDKVKSKYTGNNKKNWKIPTTYRPHWAGSNPSKRPKGKFVFVTSHSTTYKIPAYLNTQVNDSDPYSEVKSNNSTEEIKSQVKSDKDSSNENVKSQEETVEVSSTENGKSQEETTEVSTNENGESQEETTEVSTNENGESQEETTEVSTNENVKSQQETAEGNLNENFEPQNATENEVAESSKETVEETNNTTEVKNLDE